MNVASVPMRSPFRYPGGKTWFVPYIRRWLRSDRSTVREFIEPFAGGAIVGLTVAFEGLAERVTLVELDEDIAAVWQTILNGDGEWLADRIVSFQVSGESVRTAVAKGRRSLRERAFATIVRNRISRGGILAPGAGVMKLGENGKGLASRWYPETLCRRILDIVRLRDRIHFVQGNGIAAMEANAGRTDAAYFIDPPYTRAGRRLYRHSEIDHGRLFDVVDILRGDFLITYDATDHIRGLAEAHGLEVREVPMKTTHHSHKTELVIGRSLDWLGE